MKREKFLMSRMWKTRKSETIVKIKKQKSLKEKHGEKFPGSIADGAFFLICMSFNQIILGILDSFLQFILKIYKINILHKLFMTI